MAVILVICLLLATAGTGLAQTEDAFRVIYVNADGQIVALEPDSGAQDVLLTFDDPLSRAFGFHVTGEAHLAVFVRGLDPAQPTYELYVLRLSDGQVIWEQDLLPPGFSIPADAPGDPAYELPRALGAVEWSPEGQYLAFIGAGDTDPVTADVYVYTPVSHSIIATYELPNTAVELHWAPNGLRLLFNEVRSFGQGGEGYALDGYYLADFSADGEVTRLDDLATPEGDGPLFVVGWENSEAFYWAPLDFDTFGAQGLFRYEFTEQGASIEEWLPERISTNVPVLDPATDALAFTVPEARENNLVPGAYIWPPDEDLPVLLQTGNFTWVEAVRPGQFQFETLDGSYLVDVATQDLRALPAHDFGAFVSPISGVDLVALAREDGLYVSQISSDNAELVWPGETLTRPRRSPAAS
ncbi:MAG: hypothetical protein ACLFTK_13570, partial [Anaerolineales bacterium]